MNVIDLVFIEKFIRAFHVNITVAFASLLIGMLFGLPLAYARRSKGLLGSLVGFMIAILRASPVFVLMYLLLNVWSQGPADGAWYQVDLPYLVLAVALSSYSVSVISDVYLDMLGQLDAGDKRSAMLIVPNLFRIFTILVMSTSVGAAIGVQEAITVTLEKMESLPSRSEKICLILIVLFGFIVFFSMIKYLLTRVVSLIKKGG